MPIAEITDPRIETDVLFSSASLGTTRITPMHDSAARPAVTRKIEPHQNCSSSAPDTRMPRVPPAPAKPAQMPTALARSSGGNTLVIVESVPGMRARHPGR